MWREKTDESERRAKQTVVRAADCKSVVAGSGSRRDDTMFEDKR
jgi:hypothetical protein